MVDETHSLQVAKGSMYVLTQGILGSIFSTLFLMVVTRLLSVNDIGVISALTMVVALFGTFGNIAIPNAITKYIAEFDGMKRPDMTKAVFNKAIEMGLLLGLASAVTSLIILQSLLITVLHSSMSQFIVYMLSFNVFTSVFSSFLSGVLGGKQKFKELMMIALVGSTVSIGITVFLLYKGFGVLGVIVGWIINSTLSIILIVFILFSTFRNGNASTVPSLNANLVKFSIPLYFTAIISYLLGYADKYLIALKLNPASLGIYSIAVSAAAVVSLIPSSVGTALFPKLSELYGGAGDSALKEASIKASRYIYFLYVPATVGLAAVAYPTITLFFGDNYGPGALTITIISVAMALSCLGTVTGSILLSIGATRVILEGNIAAVLADVAICLTLIPTVGVVGAALGRASIWLVSFLYTAYRLKRIKGLYFDWEALAKVWIGSMVMVTVVRLVEFLYMSKYLLFVYVLIGAVVYLFMLRILHAVKKQDVELIRAMLPSSLRVVWNSFSKLLVSD